MAENKVMITADSTADLFGELAQRDNLYIFPLLIEKNGKNYLDGIDIQTDDIYEYYESTGKVVHTSALNISDYSEKFKEFTDKGFSVVHIGLSSGISSTLNNARIAAEDFDNVYVVDSLNLSTGSGLSVLRACDLSDSGMSAKEIADNITELVGRVSASFVISTLDYMHAGGRCSSASRLGANLLKLKPAIHVKSDGKMDVYKKYRGSVSSCMLEYAKDALVDLESIEPDRVFITHTAVKPEDEAMIVDYIKSLNYFKEILPTTAGCVITAHCGPETLGVLFIKKSN